MGHLEREEAEEIGGVIHCFTGERELAEKAIAQIKDDNIMVQFLAEAAVTVEAWRSAMTGYASSASTTAAVNRSIWSSPMPTTLKRPLSAM